MNEPPNKDIQASPVDPCTEFGCKISTSQFLLRHPQRILCWTRHFYQHHLPFDQKAFLPTFYPKIGLFCHGIHLLVTPLVQAWTCEIKTPFVMFVMYFADLLLMIGLVIKAHTQYTDVYGVVEKNLWKIKKRFFWEKGGWWRMLGCVPFDFIILVSAWMTLGETCIATTDMDLYKVWALARLTRYFGLIDLVQWYRAYNFPYIPKSQSRIAKTIVLAFVICHLSACVFWDVSLLVGEEGWVYRKKLIGENGEKAALSKMFLQSYYAGIKAIFFSYRDVHSEGEIAYSLIETLIGISLVAGLFGNIAISVHHDRTEASQEHRHHLSLESTKTFMYDQHFPPELQDVVMRYKEMEFQRTGGMDEEKLLQDLPRPIVQVARDYLYMDLIDSVPIFEGTERAFRQNLSFVMRTITIDAGHFVFKEGEEAAEMYFIRKGIVDIIAADGKTLLISLKPGQFFGEIALLENKRRTASARAHGIIELCYLSKSDFNDILLRFPEIKAKFAELALARQKGNAKSVVLQQQQAGTTPSSTTTPALFSSKTFGSKILRGTTTSQVKLNGSILRVIELPSISSSLFLSTSLGSLRKRKKKDEELPNKIDLIPNVSVNSLISSLSVARDDDSDDDDDK